MPAVTRSQSKKINSSIIEVNSDIPKNSKGHPSVGHLRPKVTINVQQTSKFDNLPSVIKAFAREATDYFEACKYVIIRNKIDVSEIEKPHLETYKKIFDFVSFKMNPTYTEINYMLALCDFLLKNSMIEEYEEFIINCPKKFMMTYANNSERTPSLLLQLRNLDLYRVSQYIINFVDQSKLKTWNERRDAHLRGNLLYEYDFGF
jgi:hypothetical protein